MNLKSIFVVAVAALMAVTSVANAQPYTYTVVTGTGTGDWDNPSTWTSSCGGGLGCYPQVGDTVNINNANFVVTVRNANAAAATLNLSAGILTINSPYTLEVGTISITNNPILDGNGIMALSGSNSISGVKDIYVSTLKITSTGILTVNANSSLVMQATSSRIQVDATDGLRLPTATSKLEFYGNGTIGGSGSVQGGNSDADVVINVDALGSGNLTLTIESGVTIHGGMTFQKEGNDYTATVDNRGLVKADSSLTIVLGDLLDAITDSYGAGSRCDVHWRAESGPSILSFEIPATGLVTSFVVNGSFNCNSNNVTTTGSTAGLGSYACINAGTCP